MALLIFGQYVRQPGIGNAGIGPDANRNASSCGNLPAFPLESAEVLIQLHEQRQDLCTRLGERHAPVRTIQYFKAQLRLQGVHGLGDARLGAVQDLGCRADAPGLQHRQKASYFSVIHGIPPLSTPAATVCFRRSEVFRAPGLLCHKVILIAIFCHHVFLWRHHFLCLPFNKLFLYYCLANRNCRRCCLYLHEIGSDSC